MSKKIPTAEEFFKKHCELYSFEEGDPEYLIDRETFIRVLKESNLLHVRAALKAALESIPRLGSSTDIATYEEVEKEVLNSYPKKRIV